MYISYLYYFKTLSETLNYTKAASLLHITQPSLSYAISKMEKDLGCRFFYKSGRNIALSEEGRLYYSYVCAAIEQLENGRAALVCHQNKNRIALGITKTMIQSNFPQMLIEQYSRSEPESGSLIDIYSYVNSQEIFDDLLNKKLTIGICLATAKPDFIQFSLYKRELCAVMNLSHPLAKKESVHCQDLFPYHLVLYKTTNSKNASFFSHLFEQQNDPVNAEFLDDFVDIVFYALNRNAIAIVPRDARFENFPCRVCPILDYPYDMNFYMTRQINLPLKSHSYRFYQYCKKHFALPSLSTKKKPY